MAESVYLRLVLGRLEPLKPRVKFWRANTGVAFDPKTGRPIRFGENGQGDVLGCAAGRSFAIEVKDDDGRQSEAQRKWQAEWEAAGGLYLLAVGLTGALAAVSAVEQLVRSSNGAAR